MNMLYHMCMYMLSNGNLVIGELGNGSTRKDGTCAEGKHQDILDLSSKIVNMVLCGKPMRLEPDGTCTIQVQISTHIYSITHMV